MPRQFVFWLLVVVGGAVSTRAGDLFPPRTRPIRHCFLPDYPYRARDRSLPVSAVSATALLTQAHRLQPAPDRSAPTGFLADAEVSVPVKVYQLQQPALVNGHCGLSQVAVSLQADGRWTVTFRAEQNPLLVPPDVRPVAERFVRNRFLVEIRALGSFVAKEGEGIPVLGKPEYYRLQLPAFWVEKGQVELLHKADYSPAVQQYFETVDRVEVLLRYE